jgi:polysaccharide biosynthesis/export protein
MTSPAKQNLLRDGKRRISSVVVLSFALALACAAEEPPKTGTPLNATHAADATHIRIGPGDLLEIKVFDVPELEQTVRVSDAGDASLMLLGALHLEGLTALEAQRLIESLLRQSNFILAPQISVTIREYATQGVSVLGEVRKPGVYQVLGTRTVLDIISEAGGTTPWAAPQATIKRRNSEDRVTASLSNEPSELLAREVELRPGDTVIVPKAGIVYVLGDVGRPGGYLMQNSGRVSLLEAVALAQGPNRTAAKKQIRLIHKNSGGVHETTLDLDRVLRGRAADPELQPEDIVYIPASIPKSLLMRTPAVVQSATAAAVYQAVP